MEKSSQEIKVVDTKMLTDLAIYLSGLKDGKGNLLPLGTLHLENLWHTIKFLQGVSGYCLDQDLIKKQK